jgi:hypothetical protein
MHLGDRSAAMAQSLSPRPDFFLLRRTLVTTVTIKDIPVTQELSEGAARSIVGGRWSERDETPGRPSAYDATTGDGAASMSDAWWIYGEGGVGNGGEYGKI